MTRALNRTTADLSSYPDLVVIYLGMRVNEPRGVRTLMSFGPKIRKSDPQVGRGAARRSWTMEFSVALGAGLPAATKAATAASSAGNDSFAHRAARRFAAHARAGGR